MELATMNFDKHLSTVLNAVFDHNLLIRKTCLPIKWPYAYVLIQSIIPSCEAMWVLAQSLHQRGLDEANISDQMEACAALP